MKSVGYQTIGQTEIARYTRFWRVVLRGLGHLYGKIVIGQRNQPGSAVPLCSQWGGLINYTISICNAQNTLAYFSPGAVQ